MTSAKRWRDTDHLQRAVDTAGGQDAFNTAVSAMLDQAQGWRLAELRKRAVTSTHSAARSNSSPTSATNN
jgi:hypothetical protein